MKKTLILLLTLVILNTLKADEGMWMLPLIQKLNIKKMQGMGCTLTATDIYSETNSSLKDAVVVFGGGCTGVVVSGKGLIFTNHHCGYDAIQQQSSVSHNYLHDGFVAQNLSDEIPCPGLSVKFLSHIEDISEKILSQLPDTLLGKSRQLKQDSLLTAIENTVNRENHLVAKVKSLFSGNAFYLFVWQEFPDVRLAFAPPSAIGKFGGDTDNWMWPRHTGDFSVFRVYATPEGKPSNYSKDNLPYNPRRFVTISNQGYNSGDFSMILGNPGTTNRYLSSWGVDYRMKAINMARIDIRGAKQEVWKSFMKSDEAIRIAYASKYARSSNYWKNSIGMNKAFEKLDVLERKRYIEHDFSSWINRTPERKSKYKEVIPMLENGYSQLLNYGRSANYLTESLLMGVEMPRIATQVNNLIAQRKTQDSLFIEIQELYKDYYSKVDEATMSTMLDSYRKTPAINWLPAIYHLIDKKFDGDYHKYATWLYKKSDFTSVDKLLKAIKNGRTDFSADPAIVFATDIRQTLEIIRGKDFETLSLQIKDAERLFEKGLNEMAAEENTVRHPDANSSMRLSFGKIEGYEPADAVTYNYYSTTKGILQKENLTDDEFEVPTELKKQIVAQNYGNYLDQNTGEMHVAFLSNNDITGGNSGSPILNAKGELLGLAFDGNWEAMSGDIVFEPNLQRAISVDVRYILFIMDKVYGAERLIQELKVH